MSSKNRFMLIILCYLVVFIFNGCGLRDKYFGNDKKGINNTSDKNTIDNVDETNKPTVIPPTSISPTSISPTPFDNKDINKEVSNEETHIDINEYISLKDAFIEYNFIINKEETEIKSVGLEGKYDLNNDKKEDNIKISLNNSGIQSPYIIINDVKQEFYIDNYVENGVRIIDLDEKDEFIEIACFDEGPSEDPIYIFFRFDGENIYELGKMDSSGLTDSNGRLISGFHISKQFTPTFFSAWYEIENNTFVKKNNDINEYLGLTYQFAGGDGYFIPFEEIPERIDIRWDNIRHFEPDEVKIIDILSLDSYNRILNEYFVEFSSGERGLLYFWIGD